MNVAIRYQSRGGHVKEIAQIISSGIDVEPISIDDPRAPITKHVDVLFIGGALYSFRLDPSLVEYIDSIPEGKVRIAIVFGSSALTRRPVYLIQERLKAKGIDIHPMALYMRGKPKPYLYEIAPPWAAREVRKIQKQIEEGTYGQEPKAPIEQMIEAHKEKKAKKEAQAAEAKNDDVESDTHAKSDASDSVEESANQDKTANE